LPHRLGGRGIDGRINWYQGLVGQLIGDIEKDGCSPLGDDHSGQILLVARGEIVISPEPRGSLQVGMHFLAKWFYPKPVDIGRQARKIGRGLGSKRDVLPNLVCT